MIAYLTSNPPAFITFMVISLVGACAALSRIGK